MQTWREANVSGVEHEEDPTGPLDQFEYMKNRVHIDLQALQEVRGSH